MAKKSILASLLISLGVYALLKTNYSYISMILFSFGLFTICALKFNLFTGKCGFVIKYNNLIEILEILYFNLLSGYIIGMLFSIENSSMKDAAIEVVRSWNLTPAYFIRSCLCGVIMYLAVYLYNQGTSYGIFLGVPLFILCGFQHSIANVVIMGCALTFSPALLLCVIGNWIGSLIVYYLIEN